MTALLLPMGVLLSIAMIGMAAPHVPARGGPRTNGTFSAAKRATNWTSIWGLF